MSAPDHERDPDADEPETRAPQAGAPDGDASDGGAPHSGPMNDERCLFTLSLLLDGRPVEPVLAAQAHAWAACHPECEAAFQELKEHAALLAATPPRRARAEFASRVMAEFLPAVSPVRHTITQTAERAAAGRTVRASRSPDGAPLVHGEILPFVRRLAVAAGLALAVTLCFDLARPGTLSADAALQRHRHVADHFKPNAFGPQEIEAGLLARLKDWELGAR